MNPITYADIADAAEILELQKLAYQSEAAIYNDWSIPPLTETLDDVKRYATKQSDSRFTNNFFESRLKVKAPRATSTP